MIAVDSSVLVAVLLDEPEKPAFQAIIAGGDPRVISAADAHETAIVLRLRHGAAAVERLWRLLADYDITIIPFDEVQVRAAAMAYGRYGKGVNAKARPNLSESAAYALATTIGAPLLFKGDDFTHTDVLLYKPG